MAESLEKYFYNSLQSSVKLKIQKIEKNTSKIAIFTTFTNIANRDEGKENSIN